MLILGQILLYVTVSQRKETTKSNNTSPLVAVTEDITTHLCTIQEIPFGELDVSLFTFSWNSTQQHPKAAVTKILSSQLKDMVQMIE